jgi:hypothetical protein
MFIKDNISRDIDTTGVSVKTFVAFMQCAVAEKHAFFGAKRKFVFGVRTKMGPTCATENFEKGVIWWCMK